MLDKTIIKMVLSVRGAKNPDKIVDALDNIFVHQCTGLAMYEICKLCSITEMEGSFLFSGKPVIVDGEYIQNFFVHNTYTIHLVEPLWRDNGDLFDNGTCYC